MSEALLRRLTEARLRSYDPVILTWQPLGEIRDRIRSETDALIRRGADEDFGRRRMELFPRQGVTDPTRYLDAITTLPNDSLAFSGIRFRGGDPNRPFVDVIALEGDLGANRIRRVIEALDARWRDFEPLCVRLPLPSSGHLRLDGFGPGSRVDLRVLAGRVDNILAKRSERLADGLSIRTATDMSWYGRYRGEYDRFLSGGLGRRAWTRPETYDALVRTVAEGATYLVDMCGETIGIYALPRVDRHGLRGFRIQEKFLFEPVRGTGLGAHVERAVVERLPASPDDVVLGSVEQENAPSFRTARGAGRAEIGATFWLTPPGRLGMPPGLDD